MYVKLVFILMLGMAFMETLGVASIMPFVAVLANPDIVETNHYLALVFDWFDFTSKETFMFFLGVVLLSIFVTSLAFKALTTYAITRFSTMRLHSISYRLLKAYLNQPFEFFIQRNTMDMGKSVLAEVSHVISGVLIPSMKLISGIIVAITILGLLVIVEPIISLGVTVLLGGFYFLFYALSRTLLKNIGDERVRTNRERFISASEALNGIKELKLMGRENIYLSRFCKPSERFARVQAINRIISEIPRFCIQAVAFGGVLVIVLYLMKQHGSLEAALPFIALFAFASYRLMPAFQEIFRNLTQIRFSLSSLEILYNDLTLKEDTTTVTNNKTQDLLKLNKSIHLNNVTYCYPGANNNAINEINLTIPAGSSVAFVGSTGAGKSTVVDLILGLLKPTSGEIHIDNCKLDDSNLRAWQDNIGYVPQAIYLVDDTVSANIAFGIKGESVNREKLQQAARLAHIHDFIISELPNGYETIIGERGIRFSGGQRQRLAIARALYHEPDVVVFDEATSSLDNATEAAVMEAIKVLHGRKTLIYIAHRLSTVKYCDIIFLMQDSRLIAQGSYDELLNVNEHFKKLVKTSSGIQITNNM